MHANIFCYVFNVSKNRPLSFGWLAVLTWGRLLAPPRPLHVGLARIAGLITVLLVRNRPRLEDQQ